MKPRLAPAPELPEDTAAWLMMHSEDPPGSITVAMLNSYTAADRRDAELMFGLQETLAQTKDPEYPRAVAHSLLNMGPFAWGCDVGEVFPVCLQMRLNSCA